MKNSILMAALALGSMALPSVTFAHAKVMTSAPAANASVAPTKTVSLTFNEKVMPAFSSADVVMTGMPGMASHSPMKITGMKPSWSADGKTMTLTAGRAFPKGTYKVSWRAAGADTHPMKGDFSFTVK